MPQVPPPLPARPALVVVAGEHRKVFDLAEIGRYRDLLYFLIRASVLGRYKQTVFGILWAIIQPFASMVVFSIFLGKLAGIPSEGVPYPVFCYLGLLPWQFFSGTIGRVSGSIVGSSYLLKHVYFPRVLIPISAALSGLVDYAFAFVVLFGIMAYYGIAPAPTILLLVPLVLLTGTIATGVGMGFAALNVRYRDVGYVLPFFVQLWMFATPVVYPTNLVPERWQFVFALNPMTGLIQAQRDVVLGRPLDLPTLGISILAGLTLAYLGSRLFGRLERRFADVI